MTAPAELKPCPFCGSAAWKLADGAVACRNQTCDVNPLANHDESWNRRAAPPAPAGEVGAIHSALSKLDSQIMRHEAGACEGGLLPACYAEILVDARRELAALTAQAAALEEAERVSERIADERDSAQDALLALGCRMGPDGRWMKRCTTGSHDAGHSNCPVITGGCDMSGFVPIIPAPGAAGEEK